MKLIYQHGVSHSRVISRTNRLFAIHNCHYVVEQIVRERAKDIYFEKALHEINFKEIIKKVHEKQNIPDYDRLLILNLLRNDAEHRNIIADIDTVRFHVRIVGDYLKWSYKNYFGFDYESLALEDMILDAPTRRVMREAKFLIEKGELKKASSKMFEGLGAFKFMSFGFLSDPRIKGVVFKGIDLSILLADLAFKIILAQDESALSKLMPIRTYFETTKGKIGVKSEYPVPVFKNRQEARVHYEDILSIILTYQDRMPPSIWRKKSRKSDLGIEY
jgi:hypothetical protein